MNKIIIIDTSESKKIKIELWNGEKKDVILSRSLFIKSEAALPLIDEILKRNNLAIKQIDEIKLSPNSGSFTGLRVGASIANALGFLLRIPVNGEKVGELTIPVYNK